MSNEIPPFHVGQRVVCVDVSDYAYGCNKVSTVLSKDEVYRITGIFFGCCYWVVTVGVAASSELSKCCKCGGV
jgi:hypothetical protein